MSTERNNHSFCLPLPKALQAVGSWRKSVGDEMLRAKYLPSKRLPLRTWERVATAASTLAHFGRCVQIQRQGE